MVEGYLIVNADSDNYVQVDLLVNSIRRIDPSRPVAIVTTITDLKNIPGVTDVIVIDDVGDNQVLKYFKSLLATPFEKTIALLPDQILTSFNVDVWESIRGLGPMVIPEKKISFSGDRIWPSAYWRDSVEEKTFKHASVINAIYMDTTMGARDILGIAVDLCASYDQEEFLYWIKDFSNSEDELALPTFPEFLWEQWVISFLRHVLENKIKTFNFVDCIDLSTQENNYWNPIWSKESWNKFLTYWVTDTGDIKIENFIQLGLVKYQHAGWLSEENVAALKGVNGRV